MHTNELPWTGERLVPSLSGDIVLEHLHRYALALEIVSGKDVLDIACGEGYGAYMLASRAQQTTGVDISREAVEHALNKYNRPNLTFLEGNCLSIPLADHSVDIVVSFETLEHFVEHDQFLSEVRRVMRPGGIFIVSSPDKAIYTEQLGNQNPYHPHELEADEFEDNLRGSFAQVQIFSQRVGLGSFIASSGNNGLTEVGTHRGNFETMSFTPGVAEGVYLIGVASDSQIPPLKVGLFEFGLKQSGKDVFLTPLMTERASADAKRNAELARRDADIAKLNAGIANALREVEIINVKHDAEIKSALSWQKRSWMKRAFHRWRLPRENFKKVGILKKFERSIRKRRKRLFNGSPFRTGSGDIELMPPRFLKKLERSVRKRRKRLLSWFSTNGTVVKDNHKTEEFHPLVTVIVPNFNHAPYLRKRLDSIYKQTYNNFNVLLMDDCSADGSLEILKEYAELYPAITRIIPNQINGGTPFKQWKRGILEADGDLLWIAESDDFCDADFLQILVPSFKDSAMTLAFCCTNFVDERGADTLMTYQDYVRELSAPKLARDYVETAHNLVNQALGIKNIIPNASSVLFKKPHHLQLLDDPSWLQMKICGDWIFYLYLIRGGKVGFSQKTKNYYRIHASNASAFKNHRQPYYYKEHEVVAKTVARLYKVSDSLFDQGYESLKRYWKIVWQDATCPDWALDDQYNLNEIKAEQAKRSPNVLIACHDFAGGGGEMFPIRLANELHEQGFPIVFYDFDGLPSNPEFQKNLLPTVPLIGRRNGRFSIASQIDDFGIDIIHTHHLQVDYYFSKALTLLKDKGRPIPRHVVTLHGMYEISIDFFRQHQQELVQSVDQWIYIADKNLGPFKGVVDLQMRNFAKIPAAIKIQTPNRLERQDFDIPADAFVVCVASRAIPEKGWEETIEAVTMVRMTSGRNIHLILAGEGPIKDALSQRPLPPYVHLLGYQNDVVSLYAMSDIGLLASTYKGESCPLTVIECLSVERPVVATALGEVPSMLTLEPGKIAGTLVELENWKLPIAKLADAIWLYATNESSYRLSAANCNESAKRYCIGLVGKKYRQVYDDNFALSNRLADSSG